MAGGPLPDPNHRRRNAPTIPTTHLSPEGRSGPPPEVPVWIVLGGDGEEFWTWAWATPQAMAWGTNVGMEAFVARRAMLEDDLAATDTPTVRSAILREMREMDDRLGLTPKGMAQLRWQIVAAPAPVEATGEIAAGRRARAA